MIGTQAEAVGGYSCCLTFDGKKLKQGLTRTSGDVDIFGFESGKSLEQKRQTLKDLLDPFKELQKRVSHLDSEEIGEFTDDERDRLLVHLKSALKTLSIDVCEVKDIRKKKYAKKKLIDRSGISDWKNSKYVLAISSVITYIYDIDEYLKTANAVLDEIIICLACLNKSADRLLKGNVGNLTQMGNCCQLSDSPSTTETREIRQRTETWHERRNIAKITGSSMYTAIGLDGLKRQQEHFDKVICGKGEVSASETMNSYMRYGTENEPNAMATLVGKVSPVLFPRKLVYEEGFVEMDMIDRCEPFLIVSPDGSIRNDEDMQSTDMAIKLKCPVMDIHKSLPPRYFLQCQSEIDALNVSSLVYLCRKADIRSVFIVKKNEQLYQKAYNLAKNVYKVDSPKRIKALTPEVKQLSTDIRNACTDVYSVQFVGVFPSAHHDCSASNTFETKSFTTFRLEYLFSQIAKVFETKYELMREKATEAVVFLCGVLETISTSCPAAPVCWFTKGYCVFPSAHHDCSASNTFETKSFTTFRLEYLFSQIAKVFETKYELMREKATEAVVFLCGVLETISTSCPAAPVCWFTKGYSLDGSTMHNVLEHVLNDCANQGIHIPAISFDGQWHALAVRGENNRPLTKLQLQKDIWRETSSIVFGRV